MKLEVLGKPLADVFDVACAKGVRDAEQKGLATTWRSTPSCNPDPCIGYQASGFDHWGQVAAHERDRALAMAQHGLDRAPPGPGGLASCLDGRDQAGGVASATRFGDNEHAGEPRCQVGPLIQVLGRKAGRSNGLIAQ